MALKDSHTGANWMDWPRDLMMRQQSALKDVRRQLIAQFGADVSTGKRVEPDGLALDADGAIWVGDANGHGVLRVAEGGEVLDAVDTGDLSVYAVALGGGDGRTLYLCAAPPGHAFDPERRPLGVLMSLRVAAPAT